MLSSFTFALLALLILDGLWLGVFMKGFYRQQLEPLARMADGGLDPIWPIAALVYPVIALGLTAFVLGRGRGPMDALMMGALFGAVTYAVYDLTNHATLREWSATMTVVDISWGAFSCGVTSWAVATLTRTS
jgi:uncharacterized membrane protein